MRAKNAKTPSAPRTERGVGHRGTEGTEEEPISGFVFSVSSVPLWQIRLAFSWWSRRLGLLGAIPDRKRKTAGELPSPPAVRACESFRTVRVSSRRRGRAQHVSPSLCSRPSRIPFLRAPPRLVRLSHWVIESLSH